MALVAGFNKSPVSRLKHTIDALRWRTAKRLKDFESLLSAESSYKAYRQQLHSVDPPCIPYLGVQLLDLTYIEDGNPDTVDGGLVNFAKLRLVHGLIQEVQQYQSLPYNLLAVDEIVELLDEALALHDSDGSMNETSMLKSMEQQLFALSLEREPRGADRAQLV